MFNVLATSVAPKARRTAYWHGLAVSVLMGLGGLGAAVPSLAANALLSVTVKPIPSLPACPASAPCLTVTPEPLTVDSTPVVGGEPIGNISLTRTDSTFKSFIAYEVTVKNDTGNVTNQVVFAGKFAGDTAGLKIFGTAPAPCNYTDATLTLTCNIGQLRANTDPVGSVAHFVVVFQTPTAGTQLDFNWGTTYSSGNSPYSTPSIVNDTNGTTYAKLITATSSEIATSFNTYVPAGTSFTFFTGTTGKASSTNDNRWTTTVTIPATDPTTANVAQSQDQQSCSPDLLTCNVSTLTIPGQFASLTITLRRDASTIKSGAKIQNAVITYSKIPFGQPGYDPHDVPLCSNVPGGVPTLGNPCMDAPKAYTKKNTSDPEFLGDWEFVIHALDNGSYRG
jgi:hypothetical protein